MTDRDLSRRPWWSLLPVLGVWPGGPGPGRAGGGGGARPDCGCDNIPSHSASCLDWLVNHRLTTNTASHQGDGVAETSWLPVDILCSDNLKLTSNPQTQHRKYFIKIINWNNKTYFIILRTNVISITCYIKYTIVNSYYKPSVIKMIQSRLDLNKTS